MLDIPVVQTFTLSRTISNTGFSARRVYMMYEGVLVRALNLHRDKKNVGENGGKMENFLVTQDSTHRGFSAEHSRCTCLDIDLHALVINNFEHRVLRIESINTAVQRCAINSRSTEFASR